MKKELDTKLIIQGTTTQIKEVLEKLEHGPEEMPDLKELSARFLEQVAGININELDDTQQLFTWQDLADMLDDFTDYCAGATIEELREKNKKRRLARTAAMPPRRRGIY